MFVLLVLTIKAIYIDLIFFENLLFLRFNYLLSKIMKFINILKPTFMVTVGNIFSLKSVFEKKN